MPNEPFTGSVVLKDYDPKGRPWWKRVLWYLRHPRETCARITDTKGES